MSFLSCFSGPSLQHQERLEGQHRAEECHQRREAERKAEDEKNRREEEEAYRVYRDHKPLELRVDLDDGETAVQLAYASVYHRSNGGAWFTDARVIARRKAMAFLKDGVWHDDVLYPGRRITKITIAEQPKTLVELEAEKAARDKAESRIVEEQGS